MKYTIKVQNKDTIFEYERGSLQETKLFILGMRRQFKHNKHIKVLQVLNERGWEVYGWERWK